MLKLSTLHFRGICKLIFSPRTYLADKKISSHRRFPRQNILVLQPLGGDNSDNSAPYLHNCLRSGQTKFLMPGNCPIFPILSFLYSFYFCVILREAIPNSVQWCIVLSVWWGGSTPFFQCHKSYFLMKWPLQSTLTSYPIGMASLSYICSFLSSYPFLLSSSFLSFFILIYIIVSVRTTKFLPPLSFPVIAEHQLFTGSLFNIIPTLHSIYNLARTFIKLVLTINYIPP